jgi:hypothetical protein
MSRNVVFDCDANNHIKNPSEVVKTGPFRENILRTSRVSGKSPVASDRGGGMLQSASGDNVVASGSVGLRNPDTLVLFP